MAVVLVFGHSSSALRLGRLGTLVTAVSWFDVACLLDEARRSDASSGVSSVLLSLGVFLLLGSASR